jgi:hypothetical protein
MSIVTPRIPAGSPRSSRMTTDCASTGTTRPSFATQRKLLVPPSPLSNLRRDSAAARSRSSGWTMVSQKFGVESHSSTV